VVWPSSNHPSHTCKGFQSGVDVRCHHGCQQYGALYCLVNTKTGLMKCQLTRGNPFIDKLSIGGESPLVPPFPGGIDGPSVGGIAKHGRFEGKIRHRAVFLSC
jgi:hypothetical protein